MLAKAKEMFSASKKTEQLLCRSQFGGRESLVGVDPREHGDVRTEQQARLVWTSGIPNSFLPRSFLLGEMYLASMTLLLVLSIRFLLGR